MLESSVENIQEALDFERNNTEQIESDIKEVQSRIENGYTPQTLSQEGLNLLTPIDNWMKVKLASI